MHYTTGAGLSGIITSGCLWATHASFLNDAQEIKHFFDTRLIEIVRNALEKAAHELIKYPENNAVIAEAGGLVEFINRESSIVVDVFREGTTQFNQPYIFSLSAAADEKVKANGLLSQWRGYGCDGGYAIVFDTHGLDSLIEEEHKNYYYQHGQWGDVYYYGIPSPQPSAPEITQYESILSTSIENMLKDLMSGKRESNSVEDAYAPITSLSCLYKHWGFYEEHEVRVVATPASDEILHIATAKGEQRPVRKIKVFPRDGLLVPYIELFKPSESHLIAGRLPIKRIIIGPHPERELRKKSVESLLRSSNYSAEVVLSDIPYIGR